MSWLSWKNLNKKNYKNFRYDVTLHFLLLSEYYFSCSCFTNICRLLLIVSQKKSSASCSRRGVSIKQENLNHYYKRDDLICISNHNGACSNKIVKFLMKKKGKGEKKMGWGDQIHIKSVQWDSKKKNFNLSTDVHSNF